MWRYFSASSEVERALQGFLVLLVIILVLAIRPITTCAEATLGEEPPANLLLNDSVISTLSGSKTATWTAVFGLGLATLVSKKVEDYNYTAKILDRAGPFDPVIDFASWYGDGRTLGVGITSLFLAGQFSNNLRLKAVSRDLAESFLLSAGIVGILKVSVNVKRPDGGKYSFPSGHTASAFAIAPVLHRYYGLKAGIAAYTIASFTALGRMEDYRHYLSDVLFGAAIGLACGNEVSRGNGIQSFLNKIHVSPSGVSFQYDF